MSKHSCTQLFVVLFITFFIPNLACAGSLTPPSGDPSAKFYTLTNIYNLITANTAATEGDHSFTFSDSLTGTHHTLTEIYSALSSLISADKVKTGSTYLGVAGTLTPNGGTAGVADLFIGKTVHLTSDWNLDTGTLNLACNTMVFDGDGNLVSTAYDGTGDGTNRWCMTNTGDATAANILSGKVAWVDGREVTGAMETQTLSANSGTVSAGYYAATTLSDVDADLAAANIVSGKTIFGVAGSASTASVDYSLQWLQTKDDWVNSGGTSGEYIDEEATWTNATDSPFSGYDSINASFAGASWQLQSGTVMVDGTTGLWWSDVAATTTTGGSGLTASTTTNVFTLSADGSRPTGGNAIAFCDALNTANFGGHNDWYLPTQKELMQAYVDGAANHLPNITSSTRFWSSTENYINTSSAWYVYLNNGNTNFNTKTSAFTVRCVRS